MLHCRCVRGEQNMLCSKGSLWAPCIWSSVGLKAHKHGPQGSVACARHNCFVHLSFFCLLTFQWCTGHSFIYGLQRWVWFGGKAPHWQGVLPEAVPAQQNGGGAADEKSCSHCPELSWQQGTGRGWCLLHPYGLCAAVLCCWHLHCYC